MLLVDPEHAFVEELTRELADRGWTLHVATLDADPFEHRGENQYQSIVLDPCPNGQMQIPLVLAARQCVPEARIIAMTSYPSVALTVAAIRAGVSDVLVKPASACELVVRLTESAPRPPDAELLPSLARVESEYIARVLSYTNGNISAASRTLGIRRSTLQRKLKKYPPMR